MQATSDEQGEVVRRRVQRAVHDPLSPSRGQGREARQIGVRIELELHVHRDCLPPVASSLRPLTADDVRVRGDGRGRNGDIELPGREIAGDDVADNQWGDRVRVEDVWLLADEFNVLTDDGYKGRWALSSFFGGHDVPPISCGG